MESAISPDLMAKAAGIQPSFAAKIAREISNGTRTLWRNTPVKLSSEDNGRMFDFLSLPLAVREQILLVDQMMLPLTPPPARTQ